MESPCTRSVDGKAETLQALAARWREPRALSRPVPFWLLNGTAPFAPDELARQLDEFARQRVQVVCLIPMYDVSEAYLRPRWWDMLDGLCAQAQARGVRLWIGDECACPSGSVAMRLPSEPGLASVGLQAHTLNAAPGDALAEEGLVAVFSLPDGVAVPADAWANLGPPWAPGSLLLVRVGSTPGRQGVPALAQGFGRGEVNRLDRTATARFVAETHAQYAAHLPHAMGRTISGVFTDEPALFEPPGWCADFVDEFARRKGYDPRPRLAALFTATGPGDAAFRCDFHDVLSRLYIERFFDVQRQWCEQHGLDFGGHVWQNWPWGLSAGVLWQPDPLRILAALGVPGVDWTAGAGRMPASELRLASSAARLADRSRTLVEVYAGLGPHWTYEQLRWMWHWLAVNGVDLMVLHIAYSTPDETLAGVLHPPISWQTPLWRYFGLFSDYVGRLSELLQAGTRIASVAVLYPTATVWAETVYPGGVWPKPPGQTMPAMPALERLRQQVEALSALLVEHQIDFDFIDEEALAAAQLADQALRVGSASYQALLLPDTTTARASTVRHLVAAAEHGVAVVAGGRLPAAAWGDGSDDELAAEVARLQRAGLRSAGDDVSGLLAGLRRDVRLEPDADLGAERNIHAQRRRLADGTEVFFLASQSDRVERRRVWLRAMGGAERWGFEGEPPTALVARSVADGGTWFDLEFEPFEACAVVFCRADRGEVRAAAGPRQPWRRVEGQWWVEFLPNQGNPYLEPHDRCFDLRPRFLGPSSALVPWWRLGLGAFSGSARYRCVFSLVDPPPAGRCWLDLGRVEQAAAAVLNGRDLGSRIWRPFCFEATGALVPGRNTLEVTVTNGLANFLTLTRGEGPPPLTQAPVSAMWSGLLGPVSLLASAPATAPDGTT